MAKTTTQPPGRHAALPGDLVTARLLAATEDLWLVSWRDWWGTVLGLESPEARSVTVLLIDPRPGRMGRVITKRISVDSITLITPDPQRAPPLKGPPTNGAEGAP